MKLVDEHLRSYIDDIKEVGLLRFMTWQGTDVSASWRGAYQPATHSDDCDLAILAKFNRDHYLFYLALIEKYVERVGRTLDIGCGTGARTALLARYSTSVLGIDADLMKVSSAAYLNGDGGQKLSWLGGNFFDFDLQEKFDYIFAVEVIEHLPRDRHQEFIRRASSLLSGGGRMLMTTPKDKTPDRKHPHIGLWDKSDAQRATDEDGAEISYFNHRLLSNGGTSPWCDEDTASHYVIMIQG